MSCARFSQGLTQNGVKTIGGSHLKTMSITRIIRMPSQNEGMARPAMENTRTA
ncbi:hypothetical protein D3C83_296740 [compost metagenome]